MNFQEILFLSEGEILEISTQTDTLSFIISVVDLTSFSHWM